MNSTVHQNQPVETVLQVGADGGSITLLGVRDEQDWRFCLLASEKMFKADGSQNVSNELKGWLDWNTALEQLEAYPWRFLFPIQVHPEFSSKIGVALKQNPHPDFSVNWKSWSQFIDFNEGAVPDIPQADAYGAVLINVKGEVLLREPTGHFGGYAWTFAKQRSHQGVPPSETALEAIRTEMGYEAEILMALPETFVGTTGSSAYFLAGPIGRQRKYSKHTSKTQWVSVEEAEKLIMQSSPTAGRSRDLAVLQNAYSLYRSLPPSKQPSTCKEDWVTRALPAKRTSITLDLTFTDAEMAQIRKGYMPLEMEHKWFGWYEEPILSLHRSWTGYCIYQVEFAKDGARWKAISAQVNRSPKQYTETDDDADRRQIGDIIDNLLLAKPVSPHVDQLASALAQASQPNYLGSPKVVSELIETVVASAVGYHKGETNFNAVWDQVWHLSQEISTGDEYIRIAGWHTAQELGRALVKYCGVRHEDLFAGDLDYYVSEALMKLFLKCLDLLRDFHADPNAVWNPHGLQQLNSLHEWYVTVFLGTNALYSPEVLLSDFVWHPVASGSLQ